MNRIDASDHYDESGFAAQAPSLLVVVVDTNPRAWAALGGDGDDGDEGNSLTISRAVANLLVFLNAHLAFGNDNQVAVLAAHPNRAVWLYPTPPPRQQGQQHVSADKFPPFAEIEGSIMASLQALIDGTAPGDLEPTTLISGALSLALAYIHKTSLAYEPSKTTTTPTSDPANNPSSSDAAAAGGASATAPAPTLHARILVLSVSDSSPAQYIATMNCVFAASHARIPLDTLSLRGAPPTFLQQAAFITGGTFLSAAANPRGLLTYLMFGFLADAEARRALVAPTQDLVDFRAACFCHRRVVATGFVCSICLSIFCEVPTTTTTTGNNGNGNDDANANNAECLTCGTRLALGNYGAKPAVVPRRKTTAKRKRRINGATGREETGSAAGTPAPA
ncbi:TFIIH subunit Tfb4/p34 [Xylariaceae sp. FL0804]|nr:TFIIH subunit Tfb4/p34 [Xylariaceae sp. FL0804]